VQRRARVKRRQSRSMGEPSLQGADAMSRGHEFVVRMRRAIVMPPLENLPVARLRYAPPPQRLPSA
jgi:hypothetical protein